MRGCRSLSSKVVSQYSSLLAPMAVDSLLKVLNPARPQQCAPLSPCKRLSAAGRTWQRACEWMWWAACPVLCSPAQAPDRHIRRAAWRAHDQECCCRVDLRDVKVVTKLGGTVDDSEMVDGMIFDHKPSKVSSYNPVQHAEHKAPAADDQHRLAGKAERVPISPTAA